MTRSTRNLFVLVGTVTILTLALFAVVPALAEDATPAGGQTGALAAVAPVLAQDATATPSGGQAGQVGNTVVLSTSETLGTLIARYQLSGATLRDFLSANTDLPLVPGQQVVFPAGIAATIPTTGQATATVVATSTTTGVGVATTTGTPAATTAAGGTTANTSTPVATTAAGGTTANTSTPVATTAAGGATGGTGQAQTYVIQEGDTLGTLLNMMGFQASTGGGVTGAAATATPAATLAATVAASPTVAATATTVALPTVAATATTAATMAAGSATEVATAAAGAGTAVATTAAGVLATETSIPAATVAATTAATSTVAATATTVASPTIAATATTAVGGSVPTTGGPTDDQVLQFVNANRGLRFGLLIALPAGIPATGPGTGTTGAGTGTTGTGTVAEPVELTGEGLPVTQPLSGLSGQAASDAACSTGAPKGFGYYKVRGGDTLQSISENFGVEISRILELNPGSAFAKGNVILLPGVEAPGQWNVEELCGGREENPGAETNDAGGGE